MRRENTDPNTTSVLIVAVLQAGFSVAWDNDVIVRLGC